MEGAYELFDYVLTVNAGEISSSSTALTGIGYNPVTTAIVVGNDGGKLIVGYGMQTKTVAIGFVMAYMTANSAIACTSAATAITGYNTLVPRNMSGDASNVSTAITTTTMCATNTTWVYQASRAGTGCMGFSCFAVSQPFFGLAEDWAFGTGGASPVAVYYALGALEYACAAAVPTTVNCPAPYGNGAYEVRIVKLSVSGALVLDTGDGGAAATIRSNCVFHSNVNPSGDIAANTACLRTAGHSAFLTGRMCDDNPNGANVNITAYMMVGGVGLTTQNPLMYKNGW